MCPAMPRRRQTPGSWWESWAERESRFWVHRTSVQHGSLAEGPPVNTVWVTAGCSSGVTGRCYTVEEGTAQHKVKVSLGLKCVHLPGSTKVFTKLRAGKRKKVPYLPKTRTLCQWIHVRFMDPSSPKQLLQLGIYKLLTETPYILITCWAH